MEEADARIVAFCDACCYTQYQSDYCPISRYRCLPSQSYTLLR